MVEQLSCSTNGLMLKNLLDYGIFLVREGADVAAAGILLGCVDALMCTGQEQDVLNAVSGRAAALKWLCNALDAIVNAESVFGALRALQVQTCS